MGKKRKQAKVIVKKAKTTRFTCPKCHQLNSVIIHIKKDKLSQGKIAECYCENCKAEYNLRGLKTFENEFNAISNWTEYENKLRQQNIRCPFCQQPVTLDQVSRNAAIIKCDTCQCVYQLDIMNNETFQKVLSDWKLLQDDERQRMLHKIHSLRTQQQEKIRQRPKKTATKGNSKKKQQSDSYSEEYDDESQQNISNDESYNEEQAKEDEKEFKQQVRDEEMLKKNIQDKQEQNDDEALGSTEEVSEKENNQPDYEDDI